MNFTRDELRDLGLRSVGENVQVHRSVLFFEPSRIEIGSNVRIDAYCVITAGSEGAVRIGNYNHISAGVYLFGGGGIELEDFVNLSARTTIHSTSDRASQGPALVGPTVPDELRNVQKARVTLRKHSSTSSGCVILPGVEIGMGAIVGALSLVKTAVAPFSIVAGNPLRSIGERDREFLELEHRLTGRASDAAR
jgi:dTDP-4-amino-4,6-dideoxy-D-glucose acyltransferase